MAAHMRNHVELASGPLTLDQRQCGPIDFPIISVDRLLEPFLIRKVDLNDASDARCKKNIHIISAILWHPIVFVDLREKQPDIINDTWIGFMKVRKNIICEWRIWNRRQDLSFEVRRDAVESALDTCASIWRPWLWSVLQWLFRRFLCHGQLWLDWSPNIWSVIWVFQKIVEDANDRIMTADATIILCRNVNPLDLGDAFSERADSVAIAALHRVHDKDTRRLARHCESENSERAKERDERKSENCWAVEPKHLRTRVYYSICAYITHVYVFWKMDAMNTLHVCNM